MNDFEQSVVEQLKEQIKDNNEEIQLLARTNQELCEKIDQIVTGKNVELPKGMVE